MGDAETSARGDRRWTPNLGVESLRVIHVFRACPTKALRQVRRHSDLVTCVPGVIIHPRSRPLRWVYAVIDGTVAVEYAAETHLASAGESIGMNDALLGRQPALQISAVTTATVLVTSQTDLLALAEQDATIALGIARSIAHA